MARGDYYLSGISLVVGGVALFFGQGVVAAVSLVVGIALLIKGYYHKEPDDHVGLDLRVEPEKPSDVVAPLAEPKITGSAYILSRTLKDGSDVYGITWNSLWIPLFLVIENVGAATAYELEFLIGVGAFWIVDAKQTSGPPGFEYRVGSGKLPGPEIALRILDQDGQPSTYVPESPKKPISTRGRFFLPRLASGDRLSIFLAVAGQGQISIERAIEAVRVGYLVSSY